MNHAVFYKDGLALIRLQQRLECVGHNAEGLLIALPCDDPDEVARLFVAQYGDGWLVEFRYDVPITMRQQLGALTPETLLRDHASVERTLAENAPSQEVFRGISYIFADALQPSDYPDLVAWDNAKAAQLRGLKPGGASAHVIVVDGVVVSVCESSRENEDAGEAWVQTEPAFRGRGFARQVTAAWAYSLQKRGKIPFYSHRLENEASAAVARSLKLRPFVRFTSYS